MIKPGQKFTCQHKRVHEHCAKTESYIDGHMTLGGVDKTGEPAFDGKVFTCGEVKKSVRRGVYIVTDCGQYELRQDHYRFDSVQDDNTEGVEL